MKLFFQILIVTIATLKLHSQEPVTFNCVEVEDTGDAILRWIPQGTGILYHTIYYSANGTTFDSIDFTPAVSFLYTHIGADAGLGSRWYYLKTVYNDGFALSDTLQTIYLQVDNNAPDFNQADLYWNAIHDPFPDGYSQWYKILREYPSGNWTLHDSVFKSETTFSEPVIVCYDSITYRIIIENSIGCSSISNLRGAIFRDVDYPIKPFFDSVSISQDEYPVLGWTSSESRDVTGYIVYRFENGNWLEIDRIDGRDSTFYIDSVSNPCTESFSYAIAALDSCANKSPGTFQTPLNTILLSNVIYNVCSATNTITWSAYENAAPDLEVYKIFFSIDSGPFELAGQSNPGDIVFLHEDIEPGFTYTYYIQAIFGAGSSSSCKKTITTGAYQKPAFVYFANADVLQSNDIELTIDADTGDNSFILNIFRRDAQSTLFSKIDSLRSDEISTIPLIFTDENADPNIGAYYYYVEVLDSCGKKVLTSNENKTIYLTAENSDSDNNYLQWNAFEGWDAGVEKYYIFRMIDGNEPNNPIDSVSSTTLEYIDDVSGIENIAGQLIYWVQAFENNGNEYGFKAIANSNRTAVEIA